MNANLEFRLLNEYQHDFPLVAARFAAMAAALGVSETDVLDTLSALQERGTVSRVGAVFRPRSIGASTLAALAVPEDELERVAQMVSAYPEVNHNYQREHHYNLWFVVAAPDELALQRVLREIEERSGCRVLYLPLMEDYHIDLGFDLTGARGKRTLHAEAHTAGPIRTYEPASGERRLIAAIQSGLPLVARPFAAAGMPRHRDIHWEGLKFDPDTFYELMAVDHQASVKEVRSHEELFDLFYDRLPKEFTHLRELIKSRTWRSPDVWEMARKKI